VRIGSFQAIDFGQDCGCLIFECLALHCVVFWNVLSCVVFEVQVANVVIENLFLFPKKLQTRFLTLPLYVTLRIEDVCEKSEQEKTTGNGAHKRLNPFVVGSAPFSGEAVGQNAPALCCSP
jgi:hypothetical protein